MDRSKYPGDWALLSQRIRERAEGRCECEGECGLHHGRRCEEKNGQPAKWANGTVVLTVAHLDHNPESADETRLRAFCQRCHLRYDVEHHKATAARTLDRKRKQGRLIP